MLGAAAASSLASNKASLGILLDLFVELAEPLAKNGRKPSASKVERLKQVSREAFRQAQTILEDPKAPLYMHLDWVDAMRHATNSSCTRGIERSWWRGRGSLCSTCRRPSTSTDL